MWSLGVILANLACVRNPWRQATLDDETFCAYLEDNSLLGRILPLSAAALRILAGCFAEDPEERITVSQLREMVVAAPSFSTLPQRNRSVMSAVFGSASSMPVTPVTPMQFALEHTPTPRLVHSREYQVPLGRGRDFPSSSSVGSQQWLPPTPPLSPLEAHGATGVPPAHGYSSQKQWPLLNSRPSALVPVPHTHSASILDLTGTGYRQHHPTSSCQLIPG